MKLKYLMIIASFPTVIIGPVVVGLFAFRLIEQNSFEKLSIVNDIHTRDFLNRHVKERYQILLRHKLDSIDDYANEYKKEIITEIGRSDPSYQGNFIIWNEKTQEIFYEKDLFHQTQLVNALKKIPKDDNQIKKLEIEGKEYILSKYVFSPWNWNIYGIYPTHTIRKLLKNMAKTVFAVCLGSILLLVIGTFILSQKFLIRPIENISKFAQKISNLELKKTLTPEGPSELRKLGETLNLTKDKLRENVAKIETKNDELSQFAYRTSHDLKSPLTASRGLAKYVLSDIECGELDEAKLNIKKIYKQMSKLEVLVNDILILAESDLGHHSKELLDFDTLINEIKEKLDIVLDEAQCALLAQIDVAKKTIYGEKVRYQQIMENLISNSIKYRDPNRDSFIQVKVFREGKKLTLSVEDNGVGIPKKYHPDLFKMFKRFHPKLSSGSGLGMSIVKKHVDNLDGTIHFKSSNLGTTFTITAPIISESEV